MQGIAPCLWFDHEAEDAAKFYTTVFKNAKVGRITRNGEMMAKASGRKVGSVLTVTMEVEGLQIEGLNGGPQFKKTPALSFFVSCESEREIEETWKKLSAGGTVRMGLDKYPWAERYGWTADKFGVDWQLILAPSKEKIVPAFLFVNDLYGKGEEAIHFYMSVFANSHIDELTRDEKSNTIMHSKFTLAGRGFALMEGAGEHPFRFTEGNSLIVNCETQGEVDKYWSKLSDGGSTSQCGWLKDKYGISWQIVPTIAYDLFNGEDRMRAERAFSAMLGMTKLDIEKLKQA